MDEPIKRARRQRRENSISEGEIGAAVIAWRRRTEVFAIATRAALSLLILVVYLLAPRPTDIDSAGLATLIIILLYVAFALFRIAFHVTKRFDAVAAAVSIPIDFALLGFLIDSYQRAYGGGASLSLHAPSFAFYFVFIALHGMRLDWRHALAAGVCAALSWASVVALAIVRNDGVPITHEYAEFAKSGAILIGAEVERLIAICVMTAAVALTAHRSEALLLRLIRMGVRAERERARSATDLLTQAKEAAERANALKSQFLAKMSHELRTPLNGVLGFADVLAESPLSEDQRRYVSTIRTSGESLLSLINAILDVTSLEARRIVLAREPFRPAQLTADIGRACAEEAARKGLSCRTENLGGVPEWAVGDEPRLRKALSAICDNAVKFTRSGGIVVRASGAPGGAERVVVAFEVEDTGVGVAESDLARIFDLFEQADNTSVRAFDGAGLGLAISNRLIDAMGGRISVQSALGKGSTFRVEVPLETVGDDGAFQPAAAPSVAIRPARILVVDDNRTNRLVAASMLSAPDLEIVDAEDGLAAVDTFKRGGVDLIFMDISMPKLNGIEATRAIREIELSRGLIRTPIIGLSAHAFDEEAESARNAGMDDFITKPFKQDVLKRAVVTHVRRNRLMDAVNP